MFEAYQVSTEGKIMNRRFLLNILLFLHFKGLLSLKITNLDAPSSVLIGESFWMNCTVDVESDILSHIKWYKDYEEFYRYIPSDNPPARKYETPGIHLNLKKSSEGHIFLKNADKDTEGLYRCEASAEAPTFQTDVEYKDLKVNAVPQEVPEIEEIQSKYEVGDYVNITCMSGPSKPRAVLKWHVNGEVVSDLEISFPHQNLRNVCETTHLGLKFSVKTADIFNGSIITSGCTSTISQLYSKSTEKVIDIIMKLS